jgi:hydrogenase expression/formation protein HypD
MEICGGHTHAIMKYGIDQVLPDGIELIHGPGCPVCVTPAETIDKAVAIALNDGVIFTSFGDMLRVPGNHSSLAQARSQGADIRVVYSPLEALTLARKYPEREVVFFGIGFETTAPANAMSVMQAHRENLTNFSMLVSQFRVPPVLETLLSSPQNRVQGYLGAGHVSTVTGLEEYEPIADTFGVPIVATGFEPMDLLEGILMLVKQLENGTHQVQNQYRRAVTPTGNPLARQMIQQVFRSTDRPWRGIGAIHAGSLGLRKRFEVFDAEKKFHPRPSGNSSAEICISGEILQGLAKPDECPAFGRECTPTTPLGAPMVSGEGACAAYYRYRSFQPKCNRIPNFSIIRRP